MVNISAKTVQSFVQKCERKSKLPCGNGLHLYITEAGSAKWRLKFRLNKKELLFTLGDYPAISLAAARNEIPSLKALIKQGKNPVAERRLKTAAAIASGDQTFQSVALLWFNKKKSEWGEVHYKKSLRAFNRDIFPSLGKLPVSGLTPAIVATTIEKIHHRGSTDTAIRITQHLNGVFKYAQAKGLCGENPAMPAREILPRLNNSGHMAAILTRDGLGEILRIAKASNVSLSVKMAHRLCAFTAARISNVASAEWSEFDLDATPPLWVIPRHKLKVKSRPIDLRLPLCKQLASELRDWQKIYGGKGIVFPSPRNPDRHIGIESIEKAYRVTFNLAGKHTPHGWRSAFTTLCKDNGFGTDAVHLSLDHAHQDEVIRAYDRGERFAERINIYNWWGEQLSAAENGATVINFGRNAA